jgi:hypothetical protein
MPQRNLTELVREHALPLTGIAANHDYLIKSVGDARFVLLGEASHGTHEFYHERDLVMHFDETRAVEPLERTAEWVKGELPETYPFGV